MYLLNNFFSLRYAAFTGALGVLAAASVLLWVAPQHGWIVWPIWALAFALSLLGIYDLTQNRVALLR